jgi:glucan phosphoethanolaminetransferase (alkaline phosphatase superfamily)
LFAALISVAFLICLLIGLSAFTEVGSGATSHWGIAFRIVTVLVIPFVTVVTGTILLWEQRASGWYLSIAANFVFAASFCAILVTDLIARHNQIEASYSFGVERLVIALLTITLAPLIMLLLPANRREFLAPHATELTKGHSFPAQS